jgi:chromosome segregation ATPase
MATTNDQILTALNTLRAELTAALTTVQDTLDVTTARVDRLRAPLARLEAAMAVTQAQLDALTTRIDQATADIRADIQAIKDAHPDVDVSRLEATVASLEGLDAENPDAPPAG